MSRKKKPGVPNLLRGSGNTGNWSVPPFNMTGGSKGVTWVGTE